MLWIHLSTAQNAGLEFWQTGSNAIITYQSVSKECKVESRRKVRTDGLTRTVRTHFLLMRDAINVGTTASCNTHVGDVRVAKLEELINKQ